MCDDLKNAFFTWCAELHVWFMHSSTAHRFTDPLTVGNHAKIGFCCFFVMFLIWFCLSFLGVGGVILLFVLFCV